MKVLFEGLALTSADIGQAVMQLYKSFEAYRLPSVIGCSSTSKLDYIIAYELARTLSVPFFPLPAHFDAKQVEAFLAGLPFSCGVRTDGRIMANLRPTLPALTAWLTNTELIFLTSGTSGRRKLVFCSAHNVQQSTQAILERLEYGADDTVISFLPMSFDYGFYQYVLCKQSDCVLALASSAPYAASISEIDKTRATVLPIVPSFLSAILPLFGRKADGSTVKKVTSTGEMFSGGLQRTLGDALPGATIYPMYGLTECKRVSILIPGDNPKDANSVGRPISCCKVLIENAGGDGIGEIVVIGSNVTTGTILHGDMEGESLVAYNGVLHTGDYGRLDQNGCLYITGRRDNQVKVMGVRVTTEEIEDAILRSGVVMSVRTRATNGRIEAKMMMLQDGSLDMVKSLLVESFGGIASAIDLSEITEMPLTENLKLGA